MNDLIDGGVNSAFFILAATIIAGFGLATGARIARKLFGPVLSAEIRFVAETIPGKDA